MMICRRAATPMGWLAAGLLMFALDAVEVQAAVPFQPPSSIPTALGRRIELAAEVKPIAPSGPDQSAKPSDPTPIDGTRADARLKQCKLQWTAADTDGEGVLAGNKITRYNATIRAANQPVLSEDARLTEAEFIKACTAVTAHE
jgi:hypothetical protein